MQPSHLHLALSLLLPEERQLAKQCSQLIFASPPVAALLNVRNGGDDDDDDNIHLLTQHSEATLGMQERDTETLQLQQRGLGDSLEKTTEHTIDTVNGIMRETLKLAGGNQKYLGFIAQKFQVVLSEMRQLAASDRQAKEGGALEGLCWSETGDYNRQKKVKRKHSTNGGVAYASFGGK
jgi:hypothetical protein